MRAKFRIGDVFPAEDRVAQFLVGLCMAMNDVTLVFQQMDRLSDTPRAASRENTYYMYLACAYYREAAYFLELGLADGEVTAFLDGLSGHGKAELERVRASFSPWEGSYVATRLKPIRDVLFHYKPWALERIEPYLRRAAHDLSAIEMGGGRYVDHRYEFADAVFEEFVQEVWGHSEQDLTVVMKELVDLVLAFTHFVHEAVTLRLGAVAKGVIELE